MNTERETERLRTTLQGIAFANFRDWEPGLDTAEEFVRWAQSRALHALGDLAGAPSRDTATCMRLRQLADRLDKDLKHWRLEGPDPDPVSQHELDCLAAARQLRQFANAIERGNTQRSQEKQLPNLPEELGAVPADRRVPEGWKIERVDCKPFRSILIESPNGCGVLVYSHARNPENVLYMLAEALLSAAPEAPK